MVACCSITSRFLSSGSLCFNGARRCGGHWRLANRIVHHLAGATFLCFLKPIRRLGHEPSAARLARSRGCDQGIAFEEIRPLEAEGRPRLGRVARTPADADGQSADDIFIASRQRGDGDAGPSAERLAHSPIWLRRLRSKASHGAFSRHPPEFRSADPAAKAQLSWNTTGIAAGTYEATVEVAENNDPALSALDTFSIQVTDSQPTLTGVPTDAISASVGQAVPFTAQASDPGAQQTAWGSPGAETLTFSLSGAPEGAEINPRTGEFSWTPTAAQAPAAGSSPTPYQFNVLVSDGTPASTASALVTINLAAQSPPVLSLPYTSLSTTANNAISFTATATDPNPYASYTFSLAAGARIARAHDARWPILMDTNDQPSPGFLFDYGCCHRRPITASNRHAGLHGKCRRGLRRADDDGD